MSLAKRKLVFKKTLQGEFDLVKSTNTLEFGVPGDILSREEVDRILIDNKMDIRKNILTVEFIK